MDDLPKFDPLAKCIKCGNSIPEPVKVPDPPAASPKPAAKKETAAAAQTPQAPGFALPPKPAPPTVEFCSGAECPWGPDAEGIGEHMHQFCDICGFEWLARPLDWKAP